MLAIEEQVLAIKQRWQARGYSCELQVDPPGRRFEGYVHEVDELLLLLSGQLEVEIDGEVSQPKPGMECFIPAGAVHSVRNIGPEESCWLYGYDQKGTDPAAED